MRLDCNLCLWRYFYDWWIGADEGKWRDLRSCQKTTLVLQSKKTLITNQCTKREAAVITWLPQQRPSSIDGPATCSKNQ